MSVKLLMVLLSAALLIGGCRREDIREMTVDFQRLAETDQSVITKILERYDGIDVDSFRWDIEKKTLSLRYDSMKLAQANVRYAIDEKGIPVKFPVKEGDHAGH